MTNKKVGDRVKSSNVCNEYGEAQVIEGTIIEIEGDMAFVKQDDGTSQWWGL